LGAVYGFLALCLLSTLIWALLYATDNLALFEKTYLLRFLKNLKIFQFILNKML